MTAPPGGSQSRRPRVRAFIKQYLSNSQAALVETDQGEYVVKVINNRDGPPVLIGEWVGTHAAQWLGIPVADCDIVELTGLVEIPLDASGDKLAEPGLCFGSKFIRAFGWNRDRDALEALENTNAISGVVVVDTWLRNLDRYCRNADGTTRFDNPGNLLLSEGGTKGKFRLTAIDFGYAFGGPTWTGRKLAASVQDNTIYGRFPAFRPYLERALAKPFLDRLAELSASDAESFVDGVPREWGVTQEKADQVVSFLQRRAAYVAKRLSMIPWEDDTLWEPGERS